MVMFNNESDSEGEKILRHDRFRSERVLGGEGVNGGRVREHRSPARGDRSRHDRSRNDRRSREDRSYKRGRNEDYERRHSDEKRKRDSERRSPAISKKSQSLTSHNSTESRVRGSDRERHHHNHHSSERRRSRECSSGAKTVDRKEDRRSSEDTHRSSKMKESMRSGRGESQSKKSSEEVCVKDDEDRGDGRSSEKKSPMISGDTLKPKERSSVQREVKETKAKEDNRAEEMEARTEGSHTEGMPREEFFGPALPPKKERMIGPQLPEHMQNSSMEKDKKGGDKGDSYKESMEEENGGKPSREDTKRRGEMEKEEEGMRYGPALPPQSNQDMEEGELELDDDMIGPHLTPVDSPAQIALDRRATAIRKQMENKDYYGDGGEQGKTRREDWMTKLPDDRRGVVNALQPRKFRTREPAPKGDTSSWTDTPADKHKKQLAVQMGGDDGRKSREKDDLEDERRTALLKERDREMERLVDQKKTKKRSKSLLEMHQKVLKKKKEKKLKEEGGKEERRPFDRNVDLQANRLDEAQRKAVFKKARLLDTRFATGESKYL